MAVCSQEQVTQPCDGLHLHNTAIDCQSRGYSKDGSCLVCVEQVHSTAKASLGHLQGIDLTCLYQASIVVDHKLSLQSAQSLLRMQSSLHSRYPVQAVWFVKSRGD